MFWISTILYTHLKCQRAYFWIGFHKEVLLGTRVVTGELSITLSKNSRLARTRQMEPGKKEKLYKEEMSWERESLDNFSSKTGSLFLALFQLLDQLSSFIFLIISHETTSIMPIVNYNSRRRVITHKRKVIKKP